MSKRRISGIIAAIMAAVGFGLVSAPDVNNSLFSPLENSNPKMRAAYLSQMQNPANLP